MISTIRENSTILTHVVSIIHAAVIKGTRKTDAAQIHGAKALFLYPFENISEILVSIRSNTS